MEDVLIAEGLEASRIENASMEPGIMIDVFGVEEGRRDSRLKLA